MKPKKENPLKTAVKELPKSTIDKLTLNKCFRYYYELDANSKNDVRQYETRTRLKTLYDNYIIENGTDAPILTFNELLQKWFDAPTKEELKAIVKLNQQEINKTIAFCINTICTYYLEQAEKLNYPLKPFLPTDSEREKQAVQYLKGKGIKPPEPINLKEEAKKRGFNIDKIKGEQQSRLLETFEIIKQRMKKNGLDVPTLDFSKVVANGKPLSQNVKTFIEMNRCLMIVIKSRKHPRLKKDIENLMKKFAYTFDF